MKTYIDDKFCFYWSISNSEGSVHQHGIRNAYPPNFSVQSIPEVFCAQKFSKIHLPYLFLEIAKTNGNHAK